VGAVYDRAFLSEWQVGYFSSVGPVLSRQNQSGPHGIVPDVHPLLIVGFVGPDHVIEEALLPMRRRKTRGFQDFRDVCASRDEVDRMFRHKTSKASKSGHH
jgi:hypothetical protein